MFDRITAFFNDPVQLLIVPAALMAVIFHEFCHGLVAYKLGDPTAKVNGRLSFNPIHHIDVWGLLMLIFFGFGWAKPVPVDMRYFKKPRRDFALVALAGPMSNFVLAFVALVIANICNLTVPAGAGTLLFTFLWYLAIINIGLGAFNLIPIPPLDGSKIVGIVIPDKYYYRILQYERYGMLLLMALLFIGVLDAPLGFLRDKCMIGISWLASQPFQLLGVFGL